MEEQHLISIVVPIYNVSEYLEKCIESLIKQTYENIEIILVDDGSTDGCETICDTFSQKDSRIRVIHQENSGLTVTRRNGVNRASGYFVGFVDGDDWVEPNMYEKLYTYMMRYDVDIVTSRGYREYEGVYEKPVLGDNIESGKYIVDKYILERSIAGSGHDERINGAVWNKLFKRESISKVLNNIPDCVHGYFDDTVCIVGTLLQSKSIYVSKDILYHHSERMNAFSHKKNENALLQINYGYLALKRIIEKSSYKDFMLQILDNAVINTTIGSFHSLTGNDLYKIPNYYFKYKPEIYNKNVLLYGAGAVGESYYQQFM